MDLAYYYELWRGMMLSADPAVADAVAWWQEFYVKFYMAFIEADRWKQYLDGIGTTLTATALALVLGVVLGILVALVRTAHDQQRADRRRNPVLGLFNGVCKVYVTVIRGTPMMVQLLIMELRGIRQQPQFHPSWNPGPGHQLRSLCGGDHPRRADGGGRRSDRRRAAPWG